MDGFKQYIDDCLILKDGVEIEDLKKYGFNKDGILVRNSFEVNEMYAVRVDSKRRIIIMTNGRYNVVGGIQSLLYDLIVDGMVEKVKREDVHQ